MVQALLGAKRGRVGFLTAGSLLKDIEGAIAAANLARDRALAAEKKAEAASEKARDAES